MRCTEFVVRSVWARALGFMLVSALSACAANDAVSAQPDDTSEAGADAKVPEQGNDAAPNPAQVTADAGSDQTVNSGQTVALTGQGADTRGASLTFSWSQTSGTPVELSASDLAATTFVAPDRSVELEFRLTVQSENGQASDTVSVAVQGQPALFVANRGGNSVSRFRLTPVLQGDTAPEATWAGPNTRLLAPSAIVVDKAGGLVVSNADSSRITGFADAFGPGGDLIPERYVGGATSPLNQPEGLAYDPATDSLFVANFDAYLGAIHVWTGISTPDFFGEVPPTKSLRSPAVQNPRDLELGPNGELYVVDSGAQDIAVFAHAASAQGDVTPSRTIRSDAFQDAVLMDAFLDDSDHLFAVTANRNGILVFDGAAGLDGMVQPSRVIGVSGATGLAGVAVDSAGTAYASDGVLNAVYVFDNAASRDGTLVPDRTLTGPATGLSSPGRLVIQRR